MEYKKNLFELPKKSIFRQIFGYFFTAFAFIYIGVQYFQIKEVTALNWIIFFCFLLTGIIHILEGYGRRYFCIFGKTYIIINDDDIILKRNPIRKERKINWNDIELIDYLNEEIRIFKKDETREIIDYSLFKDKETVSEVIQVLANIAEEKGIRKKQ